jgi:hypothetical protein
MTNMDLLKGTELCTVSARHVHIKTALTQKINWVSSPVTRTEINVLHPVRL